MGKFSIAMENIELHTLTLEMNDQKFPFPSKGKKFILNQYLCGFTILLI